MRIIFWTLFLFVLWMALSMSLATDNIIIGALISGGVALFYTLIFKSERDAEWLRPIGLLEYLFVLIKSLIISNMQISRRILSPKIEITPAIVAVPTRLKSDWKKLLLANSITLTPGTLTLNIKGDTLYIHIIDYQVGSDKHDIIKEFESVIAKI